jgi:hypothetical protein
VPDAVVALMSAVLEANPFAPPARLAQLLAEELRREGWHVGAPGSCRPSMSTVNRAVGADGPTAASVRR